MIEKMARAMLQQVSSIEMISATEGFREKCEVLGNLIGRRPRRAGGPARAYPGND
jgi:hypothetical protein